MRRGPTTQCIEDPAARAGAGAIGWSQYGRSRTEEDHMAHRSINGFELWYDDGGSGEVILFHHGYTGSHDSWLPIVEQLRDEFRCVMMDARGAGDSGRPDDGYTIEQYAADVIGLVDALGIERFTYVGHSMGGGIGMWLGLEYADRLDRLVLVTPVGSGGIAVPSGMREAAAQLWHER